MSTIDASIPAWAQRQNLTLLWQEDECLRWDRTAEHAPQAWQRLFGEPLPQKGAYLAEADFGDMFRYLYPDGRVLEYSYDGAAIYQTKESTSG